MIEHVRRAIPAQATRWLRDRGKRWRADPPVGAVDLGDLARIEPIDRLFGTSRGGRPIDRCYIEAQIGAWAADIQGRVLEFADDGYTRRFGRRVERSDVLSLQPGPGITLVADLCRPPDDLPWGAFDCIICTQTLQFVKDPSAAVQTVARLLRSQGVLLATVPGISQISRYDADRWGDRWRFTALAVGELLEPYFDDVQVRARGNVLTAAGLLHGLVVEDLPRGVLDRDDPDYDVIVAARAVNR